MLAVSSSRGTVHVFNTTEAAKVAKSANPDMISYTHNDRVGRSGDTGNEVAMVGSYLPTSSPKKRWYDGILSNMKKANKEDESKKAHIIRSIAKIKCEKPVVQNTVAILPTRGYKSAFSSSLNDKKCEDEFVAICFENGKLLVYAICKNRIKLRPRPVLADDIMFDSESALSS